MPAPLVALEHVNVTLNARPILRDIGFTLERGQCWAVLGPNGAGKSSFLRLVRGEVWPDVGGGVRRYAIVSDEARESPIGVRERTAFVSPEAQDRYLRLELPVTGLEAVRTGFHGTDYLSYPLTPAEEARADALLVDFGLEGLRDRPVVEMSKGQLRRVLLARAVVGDPTVLMLDEFFSGVDGPSKAALMASVDGAVRRGLTVLYTTHREEEAIPSTSHALELRGGRIVSSGPVGASRVGADRSPASSGRQPRQEPPPARATPGRALVEIERADVFLGQPEGDLNAADGSGQPRKQRVLEGINWTIRAGEQWAVVGANGAGKSTLARLVLGELEPALGGRVTRFGLERMPIWERQARIGLISSDVQVRHRVPASGFTVVASGFGSSVGWARDLEAHERERVLELLSALDIAHLADREATATSHGELKKLLIARSLVTRPDVVILDEPFDYLDARSRGLLFDLIERETERTLFVTVAHRLVDIPPSVTHALHLERGRVRFAGELGAFFETAPNIAGGFSASSRAVPDAAENNAEPA